MMYKPPGFPSDRVPAAARFASFILAVGITSTLLAGVTAFGQQPARPGGVRAAAVSGASQDGPAKTGANTESPDPEALVEEALRILKMRRSVAARIRQEVDLFGKRLVGSGSYLEQAQVRDFPNIRAATDNSDHLMRLVRLELKIQHGDQASSLVQVAALPDDDGQRFLWTKRKVLGKQQLSRINLDRVEREFEEGETKMPTVGRLGMLQAEGGLGKILQNLLDCFDLTDAQLGRLGTQGQLVWRIRARWKPEMLARAMGKQDQEDAAATADLDPSRLPPQLPDLVVLHLRHDDLFPCRIEYRRTVANGSAEPQTRAIVTMDLYDVLVDRPIPMQRFVYNPGDFDYDDRTAEYIESLKGEK